MTWTAVGSLAGSGGAGNNTLGFTNTAVGNLRIAAIHNQSNNTVWCSGLTGGGATWIQAGVKLLGVNNAESSVVFLGTVTATGAQTATATWSGTTPGTVGIVSQEFHSTVGSWAFDKQGNLDSAGTANWPSLTPAGAGELYWGYIEDSGSAVAGSTSGYVYTANADTTGDGSAYNLNVSSASFPVWGDSGQTFGIALLVAEVASSGSPKQLPQSGGPVWRRRHRRHQQYSPPLARPPFEGWGQPL